MKKIIIILLALTAFVEVANAQIKDGWDKSIHWTFKGLKVDSIKHENDNILCHQYTYDDAGRIVKKHMICNDETFMDDGSIGEVLNEYLYERKYNEAGQVVLDTRQSRIVGTDTWSPEQSQIYDYGADGRLDSMTYYLYEDINEMDTYTYDDANNKMTLTHYETDYDGSFPMMYAVDYMYDANHVLTTKDSCVVSGTDSVYYRVKYVYDNDGRLVEDTSFVKKDHIWEYFQREEYSYGDYGSLTRTTLSYSDGAWTLAKKDVMTLDENYNYTEQSSERPDEPGASSYIDAYTYNEDGNPLTVEETIHINILNIIFTDIYDKAELTYEDGKVIQKNYEKESDDGEWALSNILTYYVTKLDGPTSIQAIQDVDSMPDTKKTLVNGKLFIMKNGKAYNAAGQRIK